MTPDERLLYLARLVEQVPPRLLVMDGWFSEYNDDGVPEDSADCGTAACAAGHATRCPAFHDEGFGSDEAGIEPVYNPVGTDEYYSDWSALERFFRLTSKEASHLFSARTYTDPTPATVAARIREFVAARTAKETV